MNLIKYYIVHLCMYTANQILHEASLHCIIGSADSHNEHDSILLHYTNTEATDSEQPTLAVLLKSPSYLTYKHTSCPSP